MSGRSGSERDFWNVPARSGVETAVDPVTMNEERDDDEHFE
jgi:hypothetical protein